MKSLLTLIFVLVALGGQAQLITRAQLVPLSNWVASFQGGSSILSNLLATGNITNLVNGSSNAGGTWIGIIRSTNNGNAVLKTLTGSGAITMTDQGTNIDISTSGAAGEANVNGEISVTNATRIGLVYGKAGVTNLLRSLQAGLGHVLTNQGTNIMIAADISVLAQQSDVVAATNSALVTNWIVLRQPASATLTNLSGTGAVTNIWSATLSNATIKPLVIGVGNVAGATNQTGGHYGIEAGANITLTPNGSNYVIASSGGGSMVNPFLGLTNTGPAVFTATNVTPQASSVGLVDGFLSTVFTNSVTSNTIYRVRNIGLGQMIWLFTTNTGTFTETWDEMGAGNFVSGSVESSSPNAMNLWIISRSGTRTNIQKFGVEYTLAVGDLLAFSTNGTTVTMTISSAVLTNAARSGLIVTNVVNASTNLAAGLVGLLGPTNNGDVRVKTVSAGANMTITDNTTNLVFDSSGGGGGNTYIYTNNNAITNITQVTNPIIDWYGPNFVRISPPSDCYILFTNYPVIGATQSLVLYVQMLTNQATNITWEPTIKWLTGAPKFDRTVTNGYFIYNDGTNYIGMNEQASGFVPTANGTFLTNWINAVSNYVTSATNSASVTNWINFRQPASTTLSNLAGTGAITNLISLSLSNATIKPLIPGLGTAAGMTNITGQIYGLEQGSGKLITPNGSNYVLANDWTATASTTNVVGVSNWVNSVSNYVTAATNSASVTNWINFRQPVSTTLSNLSGTGAITNMWSATLSNASIKPLVIGIGNVAGATNQTGGHYGIEAGANITLTPNGSNYVIASTASGGGGLTTNANQFAANTTLNIKDGAVLTNILFYGNSTFNGLANFLASSIFFDWAPVSLTMFTTGGRLTNALIDVRFFALANETLAITNQNITNWAGISTNVLSNKQPSSTILTNLSGTGAITNLYSATLSNATIKPLVIGVGNVAGMTNTTGGMYGIEQGANITLTPNGSNYVIAATSGGSGSTQAVAQAIGQLTATNRTVFPVTNLGFGATVTFDWNGPQFAYYNPTANGTIVVTNLPSNGTLGSSAVIWVGSNGWSTISVANVMAAPGPQILDPTSTNNVIQFLYNGTNLIWQSVVGGTNSWTADASQFDVGSTLVIKTNFSTTNSVLYASGTNQTNQILVQNIGQLSDIWALRGSNLTTIAAFDNEGRLRFTNNQVADAVFTNNVDLGGMEYGDMMPTYGTPDRLLFPMGKARWRTRPIEFFPLTGTRIASIGATALTNSQCTVATVFPTDENYPPAFELRTLATSNAQACVRTEANVAIVGTKAGFNGFHMFAEWYSTNSVTADANAAQSIMIGLTDAASPSYTNMLQTSNSANHYMGFNFRGQLGKTNWWFTTKDNGGAVESMLDLTLPLIASNVYRGSIYAAPRGILKVRLENLTANTATSTVVTATIPTNYMCMFAGIANNTNIAHTLRLSHMYLENLLSK